MPGMTIMWLRSTPRLWHYLREAQAGIAKVTVNPDARKPGLTSRL
jgi:hypothetical protein